MDHEPLPKMEQHIHRNGLAHLYVRLRAMIDIIRTFVYLISDVQRFAFETLRWPRLTTACLAKLELQSAKCWTSNSTTTGNLAYFAMKRSASSAGFEHPHCQVT